MSSTNASTAGGREPHFEQVSEGVEMRVLRRHEGQGLTFLIRMRRGARAPLHDHPGGEETYVLDGRLRIQSRRGADGAAGPDLVLGAGEYAFVPPGETHDGLAEEETLFLVVAPGGVVRSPTTSLRPPPA